MSMSSQRMKRLLARYMMGLLVVSPVPNMAFGQDQGPEEIDRPAFRIALPHMEGDGVCRASSDISTPGAFDYITHLARRFPERSIRLCIGQNPETPLGSAARQVAKGQRDMAWVSSAAYPPLAKDIRAIMTFRAADDIARIPVAIFTRGETAETFRKPAEISEMLKIGYLSARPAIVHKDRVFSVLEQWGATGQWLESATAYPDFPSLKAALRQGEIDVAAVEVETHYRNCEGLRPGDEPCDDLETLTTQRPVAESGFVISRSMEQEWHYRLVGVHVGLHLEAPTAFEWLIGDSGALEVSPAEAEALNPLGAEYWQ